MKPDGTFPDALKTKPLPEPPHTVSVAAHVKAAIESLKKAQTVLQIEIDRLEKQL